MFSACNVTTIISNFFPGKRYYPKLDNAPEGEKEEGGKNEKGDDKSWPNPVHKNFSRETSTIGFTLLLVESEKVPPNDE